MNESALRAIANPHRREILRLVWDEELPSGEIASRFDVSWPAISQNLSVLERAGLLQARRAGTTKFYRADRASLGALESVLLEMWRDDLDRLAELAEAEQKRRRS
jgi:DNA-binding transcriptional ArsR family regulator